MKFLFLDTDIRLIIMNSNRVFGGTAIRQYYFAKGLSELGHDVGVVTIKSDSFLSNENFEFKLLETYNPDFGIKALRWIYYRAPMIFYSILKFKPDRVIIKGGGGWLNLIVLISSIILRKKIALLIANDAEVYGFNKKYSYPSRLIQNLIIYKSSHILCQNKFQLDHMKRYKNQKRTINTILNPIDINLSEKYSSTNRKYIAFIGTFRKHKNLQSLYNIAKSNTETLFKIAGKEIETTESETKLIMEELRKLNNVEFVGFLPHDKIKDFLMNAKALLNTSFHEGFSNTFLEAFSVGTPIISLYVDPNDILKTEKLGFKISEKEFSQIIRLLDLEFDYKLFYSRSIKYIQKNHYYLDVSNKLAFILK